MPRRKRRSYYLPLGCIIPLLLLGVVVAAFLVLPSIAVRTYGPPSESLNIVQRLQYSAMLLWYDGLLTRPAQGIGGEQDFAISAGEGAASVAARLEQAGLVRDADALRAYLIYSGLDTSLQAGEYRLSPALTAMQIAQRLQDATPAQVKFVVLPGWRMEEIAAALPTSGMNITPEQFLAVARAPRSGFDLPPEVGVEGFLFPDQYTLPRIIQAEQLVSLFMDHFSAALTPEMRDGFAAQGLSVYQAVTLASIVQREAVELDEQPVIASVFLNRLAAGMRLDGDPTVQYALGYNPVSSSWWKSPLSLADLEIDSPYNTYKITGLPPGPIANPSLSALQAVAKPASSPYYYFRARCDGSRRHAFAETFEEQVQNACE